MVIRLEDLLASFRRHLRAAAKAPRTIELYGQSVEHFGRWLTDRGRPATLEELTRHAISAWLAETCEASTVGTRLRGMRRFCRRLVTEGELEKAPTDGIEIPRQPDQPVPILTDEEIAALLKACAVGRGRPGVRPRRVPRSARRGGAAAAARHRCAGVGAVSQRDCDDAHLINAAVDIHHDDPESGYRFTVTWLIRQLAVDTSIWADEVWVIDPTPIECARSREAVRRSGLAGWLAGWAE